MRRVTDKRKYQLSRNKVTARSQQGNENEFPVWTFENFDKDGKFKVDPNREDFDCRDFLNKMLAFSQMTWGEIKKQTHDRGKSKHHFLSPQSFSKEAAERIDAKGLNDYADYIFSFALNNTVRVIGVRDPNAPTFQVVWYDPTHEFAPSNKKHT